MARTAAILLAAGLSIDASANKYHALIGKPVDVAFTADMER